MKRIALSPRPEVDGQLQDETATAHGSAAATTTGASEERRMSWNPADIHILVVDDETVTRLVMEQLLKQCGYQAITSTDRGQTALELLRKFEFHVVLLDLRMPGMDGLQVLREIMRDPKLRNIPIIMMSATEDLPLTYTCLRSGACHFLVKPIQAQTLKNLWQTIFKWRNEQRMAQEFEQQRRQLEQEVQSLRRDVTHAVEAPIVTVVNTLHELISHGTVAHDTRQTLLDILKSLQASSSNIYQPPLETILNNLPDLDTETRRWLISELCIPESTVTYSQQPPTSSSASASEVSSAPSSLSSASTSEQAPTTAVRQTVQSPPGVATDAAIPPHATATRTATAAATQQPPAARTGVAGASQHQTTMLPPAVPSTSSTSASTSASTSTTGRRGSRSGDMALWHQQVAAQASLATKEEAIRLGAWDFDVWQIANEDHLINDVAGMWEHLGVLAVFRISRAALVQFFQLLRSHYHTTNPYHNFRHCIDVAQAVYHVLLIGGANRLLQPLEILAALLAAVIHDVGHDGHNNAFHVATGSHLALLYNDRSVLENYHCSQGWQLIMQTGLLTGGNASATAASSSLAPPPSPALCGLATTAPSAVYAAAATGSGAAGSSGGGLSRDELKIVRRLVVDAVLATDISQHMELSNKFKALAAAGFDPADDSHRSLLVTILVKFGDLSNPCRPVRIAKHWARMVQEEFFLQGDAERQLHLPVSPFMDRGYSLAQMQLNFIDYIVHPLVAEIASLLPSIQPVITMLGANQEHWRGLLEEERRVARLAPATSPT